MLMLDPKMYLHGNSKSMFIWTQVLADEDSPVSYVGYTNQDDVLLVQSTIADDVTTTLFACSRNSADQIDDIWTYREFQPYTRFDLTRSRTPTLLTYYQPFDFSDGSGDTGGTTEDPSVAGKENVQIVGGKLTGVLTPIGESGTNSKLKSTLDTYIPEVATITVDLECDFLANFSSQLITILDECDSRICYVSLLRFIGGTYIVEVANKSGAQVASMYPASQINTPIPDGELTIVVNLVTKKVSVFHSAVTLESNIDIDISDGGALTSNSICCVENNIVAGVLDPTSVGTTFDNLTIYNGGA